MNIFWGIFSFVIGILFGYCAKQSFNHEIGVPTQQVSEKAWKITGWFFIAFGVLEVVLAFIFLFAF